MKRAKYLDNLAIVVGMLVMATTAIAQNPLGNRINWIGQEGLWNEGDLGNGEGTNWENPGPGSYQPSHIYNEYASINQGRVLINSPITAFPTDIWVGETGVSSLVIQNGGSISVQPSDTFGNGELILGGAAQGNLGLEDGMGDVHVAKYRQNSNSLLAVRVGGTGMFSNHIRVSESIQLGGQLRLESLEGSGYKAQTGDSWTIISGAPVTGSFSSVNSPSGQSIFSNPGQTINVSTENNAVTLSIGQRLILNVDRATGEVSLSNPAGHSIDIDFISYTLSSTGNTLNSSDSRWHSLQDAAADGWFEAVPLTGALSELSTQAPFQMSSGDTLSLGNPINPNMAVPLGTNWVNTGGISFAYQDPVTGLMTQAAINPVGRVNNLALVVDPDTGNATIQNQSRQTIDFISYTISSSGGSLLDTYQGIQGSGPDWYHAGLTSTDLSELSVGDAASMLPGDTFDLGIAWDVLASQDLTFAYQDPLSGDLRTGAVIYGDTLVIEAGLDGDFNNDGFVDAADYTVWRNNLGGSSAALNGNGTGAATVSIADYDLWKANFGNSAVNVALASSSAPVPEPATTLAGLIAAVGLYAGRGRRRAASRQVPCAN